MSCVKLEMIQGWLEYPGNLRILRQGRQLCPSRNNPGLVEVSQESQDTQAEGW